MSKRAIFLASTAAGLALFATVGFMQSHSGAFTSAPRVDLDSYLYSEVRAPSLQHVPAATPPEPAVVVLPALKVVANPPHATSPAIPVHLPSVPCSPWREIGPRNVTNGVPTGSLQVRDLC